MNLSFDHTSDEMPAERGRNKIIHSSGSIAFIPTANTPFTGVFKTGADGIIRLSLAANPDAVGSYTPGMGFKLLIDGKSSVNVMAMYSLDGQDQNKNFFANTFSNRIAEPKGFTLKLLKLWFGLFAADPLVLGVDHFAAVEKDGRLVANPVVPYQLLFVPTKDVQLSATSTVDFRSNLATLKSGTYMYIVKAKRSKNDTPFVIGYVKLMSELVPSEYGDHQLFFQHRE